MKDKDMKKDKKEMVKDTHMSEEDIKKLAEDIYRGLVFTDRHIKNPEDVNMVFMALVLLNDEQIEKLKSRSPGMIYEYMDHALPRSINGMPTFLSFRVLNKEDAKKVDDKYLQIKNAIEKI